MPGLQASKLHAGSRRVADHVALFSREFGIAPPTDEADNHDLSFEIARAPLSSFDGMHGQVTTEWVDCLAALTKHSALLACVHALFLSLDADTKRLYAAPGGLVYLAHSVVNMACDPTQL